MLGGVEGEIKVVLEPKYVLFSPEYVRKAIYMTNAVEAVHHQFQS